jgi:hypothetical protein
MIRRLDIPVQIGYDWIMVPIILLASKTTDWLIDGYIWAQDQYTFEQNEAILEACMREECFFYDVLNEQ